jgi:hypothetical protein
MIRILLITLLLTFSLKADDFLLNKVENIIGTKEFNTHKNLVNVLFQNKRAFYIGDNLNYLQVLKKLKQNGLLKLRLSKPKEIIVKFETNYDPIKSLKILNDTLKSLGYYYYFTKSTRYDGEGNLIWSIKLKTSYAIDPMILAIELANHESRIINLTREENDTWKYVINTQNAKIADALYVDTNEKVILQKPLKPYLIKMGEAKTLKILSRKLNNWHPHIVFYDQHLTVLRVIKKDRVFKGLSVKVPEGSTYIKITDLYTLINIKRGLSIITKE